MKFTGTTRIWSLVILLLASLAFGNAAAAQSDGTSGATPTTEAGGLSAAAEWLMTQQAEDGSFAGFSGEADASSTIDVIFALVAAQSAGVDTSASIERAMGYLESGDVALVFTQTGPGQAAKLALVLSALGLDPNNIANVDPLSILDFGRNADTGLYGFGPFDHALALLALSAAGSEIPSDAIDALANSQAENGGWAFDGSTDDVAADSNTTAMVIQAIAASGQPDLGMTESGLGYLESTLKDGEGAAYNVDTEAAADSNSTALVSQAVIATGGDPASGDWQDLTSALLSFQNGDGSFGYQVEVADPNLLSTAQAIPALVGLAYPFEAVTDSSATPVGIKEPTIWSLAA